MATILIKKKLTLEFLGDEYKDDYLTFKSIPLSDYDEVVKQIEGVDEKDNKGATQIMLDVLKKYFLDGSFGGDKVVPENLNDLDGTTVMKCFETLTGQVAQDGQLTIDPKSESESTTTSTTEVESATKS